MFTETSRMAKGVQSEERRGEAGRHLKLETHLLDPNPSLISPHLTSKRWS